MPLTSAKTKRHQQALNHLSRIEGQLRTLRHYITTDKSCTDIAQLTASISASFQTLKIHTLSGYIRHQLTGDRLSQTQQLELDQLLNLYKK